MLREFLTPPPSSSIEIRMGSEILKKKTIKILGREASFSKGGQLRKGLSLFSPPLLAAPGRRFHSPPRLFYHVFLFERETDGNINKIHPSQVVHRSMYLSIHLSIYLSRVYLRFSCQHSSFLSTKTMGCNCNSKLFEYV